MIFGVNFFRSQFISLDNRLREYIAKNIFIQSYIYEITLIYFMFHLWNIGGFE